MTTIDTLAELLERLEDIRADINTPSLWWAAQQIDALLELCREHADAAESERV